MDSIINFILNYIRNFNYIMLALIYLSKKSFGLKIFLLMIISFFEKKKIYYNFILLFNIIYINITEFKYTVY